jgi:uncharacterized membrane protein (DUF4010 family)
MELDVLLHFLAAIALGALVGVERQRNLKEGDFAGIRTFTSIAFLGAISSFLYQRLDYQFILPASLLAISGLIIASYVSSSLKGYYGLTAEISAILTFLLGFMVMFEDYRNYALVFGVLLTVLLSFKDVLHKFVEGAKDVEWKDTLKFALITFVILPILPKEVNLGIFDQGSRFYDLNIINPREIWMLVILVSGISFVGYFFIKSLGGKRGANLTGTVGGIVSSTAVTQSMAGHSKATIKSGKFVNSKPLVCAVLLATIVSFVRIALICLIINKELSAILIPLLVTIVVGFVVFLFASTGDKGQKTELKLKSPLKLKPALILASLYAILTIFSKLSYMMDLGKSGIIIASVVTGFFDVDPVILSVGSLSASGTIGINDSITAILLALASNQITKSFVAISVGSKKFGLKVGKVLLFLVTIILLWILFF